MSEGDDELRRGLGPFDATAVVIGAIVGVGIFFTPSRVAAVAGSSQLALLTWGLGGVVAMLGAMTLAELGGLYPRSGGQYVVLRDAFGSAVGFCYVVCNATAIQAGAIAIIALVCVKNLAIAFGVELGMGVELAATAGVVGLLTAANAAGLRWGAQIQNLTVVAKVATLLAITGVAFLFGGDPPAAETGSSELESSALAGVAAGLVPVLFSFGGWQMALWMGGEVREPERNLPRAIVLGVAVVIAIYLAANWAYFELLGHAAVADSDALAADAVAAAFSEGGRRAVAAAVGVSAFGVLNANLLTGPRLIYALARDGRFFSPFAKVHAEWGTPVAAVALLGGMSLVLLFAAGADGVDRLLTGVVLVDGCFFALTGAASLALERRHPHAKRPVRMPGYPAVPLLFALAEIGVVIGAWMDPKVRDAAFIGVAWIAVAFVAYLVRFRRTETS